MTSLIGAITTELCVFDEDMDDLLGQIYEDELYFVEHPDDLDMVLPLLQQHAEEMFQRVKALQVFLGLYRGSATSCHGIQEESRCQHAMLDHIAARRVG